MSQYIVTFKPETPASVIDKEIADVEAQGGEIRHKYDSDFLKGFAASLPEGKVQAFSSNPHVANVEADQEVKIQ